MVNYFFVDFSSKMDTSKKGEQWMSMQTEIDSLKAISKEDVYKITPFNPNFITDFKGYKLGMKVSEIDRLLAFRKTNKYVNSAQEFQKVTQVSDSLLAVIAPYFKFPDWVTNKKKYATYSNSGYKDYHKKEIELNLIDYPIDLRVELIQTRKNKAYKRRKKANH